MTRKTTYVSSLSPEYVILGLLFNKPDHGYDLHHRLSIELGYVWRIPQSQLYTLLKRLERQGDIRSSLEEQSGLPDKRIFHLTAKGQDRFVRWMETPSGSSVRAIRVEFLTRLFFAQQHNPEQVNYLIHSQMQETSQGLAALHKKLNELPKEQVINRLGLELRIRQLSLVLEWLEECRRALHDG